MSQIFIDIGATANDGEGTPLRNAFEDTNLNFNQVFARAQSTPPSTVYGKAGDQAGWYAYSSSYFYYCFQTYTDGVTPIWAELAPIGNISATQIINGSSSVTIQSPGANVNVTVAGVANVAQFTPTGINVNGSASVTGDIIATNLTTTANITATGNVVGTYFFGNGSLLTGVATSYGNSNVADFLTTYNGNLASGNLSVAYNASVAGNVVGQYFVGNGSQLTGLPSGYTNADVAAFLPTYTGVLAGNALSVTGNVTIGGSTSVAGNVTVNYTSRINGTVNGQLNGLVNNINTQYGTWDFGAIATNTYTNPTQWIFALTPAGNVNMGTVTAPTALSIDIGTIF